MFASKESENNIEDVFVKFSGADINSERFTELLMLLHGFYELVYSQLQTFKDQTCNNREEQNEKLKAERLISGITSKSFYNNIFIVLSKLKAFTMYFQHKITE